MRTEDLIRTLAADGTPPRPLAATLVAGLLPALTFAVVAVGLVLGYRPNLGASFLDPVAAARYALPLLLMALALPLCLRLARPEGAEGARTLPLILPAAAAAALVVWAFIVTPAEGWGMAWRGKTMVWCLVSIPTLSILPAVAIFAMLRGGATTAPRLAGAVAGLAAGGGAAAAYALHCTEDSPLFFVCWYGLAILAVTGVCAWAGPRLLRW